MPQEEPDREVVLQILSYFFRNPGTADTLEGIARWRLLEEQIHHTLEQTRVALAWLVSQGLLREVQTRGSSRIFQFNSERESDALRLLRERKPQQEP